MSQGIPGKTCGYLIPAPLLKPTYHSVITDLAGSYYKESINQQCRVSHAQVILLHSKLDGDFLVTSNNVHVHG